MILEEQIDCSIDRLTMICESRILTGTQLYFKVKEYLIKELSSDQSVEISEYGENSFGIVVKFDIGSGSVYGDWREENVIFVNTVLHQPMVLRIDFNPNTISRHKVERVWSKFQFVLRVLGTKNRLSRFDLAFDIFDGAEIRNLRNLKGGITRKEFYGRSGAIETIYWGSQASDVQIRLYDKLAEIGANTHELEPFIEQGRYFRDLWRLELQLRTKVIDENMIREVEDRLSYFILTDTSFSTFVGYGLEPELARFAKDMFENQLEFSTMYSDIPRATRYRWSSKVKKILLKNKCSYIEEIKKALKRDSTKLAEELKKYCDIYLGF